MIEYYTRVSNELPLVRQSLTSKIAALQRAGLLDFSVARIPFADRRAARLLELQCDDIPGASHRPKSWSMPPIRPRTYRGLDAAHTQSAPEWNVRAYENRSFDPEMPSYRPGRST